MGTKKTVSGEEKKSPKAPKWLLWVAIFLAVLITIGVLVANMLINGSEEEEDTQTEETAITQEEAEEGDVGFVDEEFEEDYEPFITWESMEIPSVYPEYTDGEVGRPDPPFQWRDEGIPNFVTVFDTSREAVTEYVRQAVEAGWEEEEVEDEMGGSIEASWILSKEEDDKLHTLQLNWHGGENPYLSMILTSTDLE